MYIKGKFSFIRSDCEMSDEAQDDISLAWDILNQLDSINNAKDNDDSICCSGCKSKNILDDYSSGYKVCGDCGEIREQIYDKSPEWSQFDEGKGCGSIRCGGPTNPFLPVASLGTTIMACATSKIKKLHNWGQMPYDERALKEVLDMIDSTCKKNNIVKAVSDCAQVLFSKLYKVKHTDGKNEGKKIIFRGKNRLSIIAACVYYGALYQNQPRSSKEVAQYFSLDVKQVSKGIRHLLELMKNDNIIKNLHTSNPTSFIRNFCIKKLPKEYIPIATDLADNVTKLDLASNHQPNSIAAACVLLLVKHCNLTISKKDIIHDFKISEPTLNKTLDRLERWKDVLFNTDISNKLATVVHNKKEDDPEEDINVKLAMLNINVIEQEPKQKRQKSRKKVEA